MTNEFALPDVGEGLTEAEIVSWRVAVGDTVAVNDVLVDIETAKSIVELPSPFAGTVQALLVEEGQTVPVGTPIISIGDGAAAPGLNGGGGARRRPVFDGVQTAATITDTESGFIPPAEPERQEMLVGYGPRADGGGRRRRRIEAPEVASAPAASPTERPAAKPPVRKLAKDLGIDLGDVPADGEVVTRADVEAYASLRHQERGPEATSLMTQEEPGETRIPVKGVRKVTAEAMVASAFTAPHVSVWTTLDVTRTVELVDRLKTDPAFADVKVSPLLVVAKAVCLALRRTPELNATWAGEEIVVKHGVNLGIAAATERGLVVPNIVGADKLTLHELAVALGELVATARAGRTQPAQMSGGTFSITNIGVFGIDAGTPILNPGESGILAVGAIERRPWVADDDTIVPRWVTTLALSFDHRVVDGEQGSRFLADVAAILRDPALALTY